MDWKSSMADILQVLNGQPEDQQFHYPIRHGTMRVGVYAPRGGDSQSPHLQDELYIIASGSGWFVKGGERIAFAPQDVLFAEAGISHRFEDFTDDFAAWVIFWGPEGGEERSHGQK
jgi:mannose-6-phosphate isomerase-like protein (cupin superfamily)